MAGNGGWTCHACGSAVPGEYRFCGHCGAPRHGADVDEVLRALVGDQLRAEVVAHGGRLPDERRLVTTLFADLSGFTALGARLDPEALAAVVDPLLAGLVRIVKRWEGHVGSFAGDALLCYFGAPVAHEDDAARAVRAAGQMLAEFPALVGPGPAEGHGLSLRIGIDTGAVMARLVAGDIRTDYNILGNAVNMAQRLQAGAPAGACLVGEATWRLTRDAFEYDALDPLRVKGRSEPLPAYRLRGEVLLPLQRRSTRSARLHGRAQELAAIADAEQPGPARGLLVVAEAGGGKSRLLEEARRRSARPWHEGGCAPHDRSRSYLPWQGVLASLRAGASDGVRIVRGEAGSESQAPAVRRDTVAMDVAALLRDAAPVTVVLEDLHWADQPTLDLLDDLLFDLGDADVLLLATSREKVSTSAEPDLLELGPLEPQAVAGLLAELLGGDPPEDLVADVLRRSGGNPLLVGELAVALRDHGLVSLVDGGVLVTRAAGLASALDLVPDSLEGLIGARIDALPAAQERVLAIAAALGPPVSTELVAAVSAEVGEPAGEVADALAGLRAARLLAGDDFVHALVQSTAYLRTTRERRRRLHRAAAAVAPGRVPEGLLPGFLARHLYLAGGGPRAVEALERAAAEALGRGAHEEALLHLTRETELRRQDEGPDPRLPTRLVALGELLELLGRYAEAEPVLREAVAAGAGPAAYPSLLGALRRLGRYDEVVRVADELLDTGPEAPIRARVVYEKAAALATQGDLDGCLAALEPMADPVAQARLELVRGYCVMERDGAEAAIPGLEAAIAVLEGVTGSAAVHGRRNLAGAYARVGRHLESLTVLESGLRTARKIGDVEEAMQCLINGVVVAMQADDVDRAERYARESVTLADRMRHAFGRALTRNNLACVLLELDQPAEARELASTAIGLARSNGLVGMTGSFLETRGRAAYALGDIAAAVRDARDSWDLVVGTADADATAELLELLGTSVTDRSV